MTRRISWWKCLPLLGVATSASGQPAGQAAAPITIELLTRDTKVAMDGSFVQTFHVEMRAGSDAAAAQAGQISVPYDSANQDVAVIDAHTLKADGTRIPVATSAIYDQASAAQQALVSSQRVKVIVFPQFAGGDKLVYTVRTTARASFLPKQFIAAEIFPRAVPYREVRETIVAPKDFPLFVESHEVEFSKREDASEVTYSWRYSHPQAETQQVTWLSPLEHTPRFFASSFQDYAALGRAYAEMAAPKRVVTPRALALAQRVTSGISDPKMQAQKLYEWVSTNIRYVAIVLGSESLIPHDVDAVIANGYGDCKDHDLLLQVLLKAKGIESQSILLNGDDDYAMTQVPTFVALDHVITFIPQFHLYLDSTAQGAPFGLLPMGEYGKPMVVASVTAPRSGTMPILEPGIAKVTLKTVAQLDAAGRLSGTSTTSASGPYAVTLRAVGQVIQAAGPNAASQFLSASGFSDASGTITQQSPTGFEPDFTISSTFNATGWADEAAGRNSFFMPPVMRLLGLSGDGIMGPFNPGTLDPNESVPCFSASATEELSLKAPAGKTFSSVPKNLEVKTANLRFTANWSLAGDTITVRREFVSSIKEQFCAGSIRSETTKALKQIAGSYNETVQLDSVEDQAAQSLYASAKANYDAGRYGQAVADLDKILAQNPTDGRAHANRGLVFLRAGQYDAAIVSLSKAIDLKFADAATHFNRGSAKASTRQYLSAIADFDKAIALKSDERDYYTARGRVRMALGQEALAVADFDKVIAMLPNVEAYHDRANAYMQSKQYAREIADRTKALELRPGDVDALYARAYAYLQAKQYQAAIADFDAVIAQRPNMSYAFLYRGAAKSRLGRNAEGEADIAAAVKLDPSLK